MTSLFPPKKWGKELFKGAWGKKIRMAEIVVQCKRMNLFLAFFYLYGEVSITEQQPTLSRICKKKLFFFLIDVQFSPGSRVFFAVILHTHTRPPRTCSFLEKRKKHHAMLDRRKKHDIPPNLYFRERVRK